MKKKLTQKDFLKETIEHIDITKINSVSIVEAMSKMSFSARNLARATEIFEKMLKDKDCAIILSLAGSTSAAGCMQVYSDMIRYNMVDAIVATGASIIDMDFFEALGFKHYKGSSFENNILLQKLNIDRIYDTYISEDESQKTCNVIAKIADSLESKVYSSREFIEKMGEYIINNRKKFPKEDTLIELAYKHNVPIFCPAFSDSSAGYGLVKHQVENKDNHIAIDSVKDFKELTHLKMNVKETGIVLIGGGVPKNFVQDVVVCTEYSGKEMPMHKYAIQISVADERDGALSGSTFKEAQSWGKIEEDNEQMVFSEATMSVPLMVSCIYHKDAWKKRKRFNLSKMLI